MKGRQHFLDVFFNPSSVAVIGASRDPSKLSFNLVENLVRLKFPGTVYPVNPNAQQILGIRTYPDLKAIEGTIDLAICAVSAAMTVSAIKDCLEKGVKGVVLVPGGFSEVGEKGRKIQDEIAHLLRDSPIRATGPNALSPINTANNFAISFYPIERLRRGNLSFVFQSGLYEPRLDWIFSEFNLGISKLIDLGNKMDINEVDALEYLAGDPDTRAIAIHLESIAGDGRRFMRLLRDASSRGKPIVVLKSGRTPAGTRAASSHSGAIIKGSDAIFDAAMKQSGVIRAQSLEEFFDFAKAFEFLRPPSKNRIAVGTFPGGEGVIAADLCHQHGFSMAELSQKTFFRLQRVFPPWEISLNPFDFGVCMQFHPLEEVFHVFLDSVLNDQSVDCLAVQVRLDLVEPEQLFESYLVAKEKKKPLVTWVPDGARQNVAAIQWLESNHIPVYLSAERAIKAISALHRYKTLQRATS